MPLDDILYGSDASSEVSRGNGGVLPDIHFTTLSSYVSPNYFGGYWSVTETFKTSADVNVADGTVVHAFHATTHALVGSGTTTTGVATFQVATPDNVYLVLAEVGGETVRTTAVAPS
jgi:hypothetical protein